MAGHILPVYIKLSGYIDNSSSITDLITIFAFKIFALYERGKMSGQTRSSKF